MNVIPEQIVFFSGGITIIKSFFFFVRLSVIKCNGDVIASIPAFGFVMPITLKELPRQLLVFSGRPLKWLSPITSILCHLRANVAVSLEVFSFILFCSDALCFTVLLVSFLDIHPLIMLGVMYVSSFFMFDCWWVKLGFWRLSSTLVFVFSSSCNSLVVKQSCPVYLIFFFLFIIYSSWFILIYSLHSVFISRCTALSF